VSFDKNRNMGWDTGALSDLLRRLSRRRRSFYLGVVSLVVLLWLASGIYQVQPGEEGVVRTFGQYTMTC